MAARPIVYPTESITRNMPVSAPGITIKEIARRAPEMSVSAVRHRVRQLVADGTLIKIDGANFYEAPHYHLAPQKKVEV